MIGHVLGTRCAVDTSSSAGRRLEKGLSPAAEYRSERRESNPRIQLGKLALYH